MQLKQVLKGLGVAIAAILLLSTAPLALAAGNQSNQNQGNQSLRQPALLIAPEPDFKIGVYPKPNLDLPRLGYGLGGDRVTVLEQFGTNEGYAWDYVRFDAPPHPEGWVRGDFIALINSDQRTPDHFSYPQSQISGQENRYLGSQQNANPGQQQQNYQQRH